MTSRYWLLTINNPTSKFEEYNDEKIKILIGQLERGENGTPHWQLYCELGKPARLGGITKLFPGCHAERRKGTRAEAIKYCTKNESREEGPFYRGISSEGCAKLVSGEASNTTQARLLEAKERIDKGASESDIADDFFELWVRYYKAFERYRTIKTPQRHHEMNVIVVQGPTGTGKSRWALEQFEGAYWKQRSNWWDGYSGHKTVILDEFYGWLPFDLLLRLCDRYPLLVESKGGQIQMVASTVVITTNKVPHMWYSNVYFASFTRRVSTWKVFNREKHSEFTDYSEAKRIMLNL